MNSWRTAGDICRAGKRLKDTGASRAQSKTNKHPQLNHHDVQRHQSALQCRSGRKGCGNGGGAYPPCWAWPRIEPGCRTSHDWRPRPTSQPRSPGATSTCVLYQHFIKTPGVGLVCPNIMYMNFLALAIIVRVPPGPPVRRSTDLASRACGQP